MTGNLLILNTHIKLFSVILPCQVRDQEKRRALPSDHRRQNTAATRDTRWLDAQMPTGAPKHCLFLL